jgi:hypothetical protein
MIIKMVRYFISAGVVLCAFFSTLPAAEDYSTWLHAQKIILNTSSTGSNVPGNVYGFPVLIRLNPSNFSGFASTLAQGADVRFAKSNGAALSYEIERWVDDGSNRDTAEIWVKVDTIFGNNSTQYFVMYWGKTGVSSMSNPASVFDRANGFAGVWHLHNDPSGGSGAIKDATSNANNGTSGGTMTSSDRTAAMIGQGLDFDGTDDGIVAADAASLDMRSALTVSAWFTLNSLNAWLKLAVKSHTSDAPPYTVYSLGLDNAGRLRGEMAVGGVQDSLSSKTALAASTYYHATFTYNYGDSMKLYVNGALDSGKAKTGYIDTNSQVFSIGQSGYSKDYISGIVDEVRLSNVERSANWIKLSYENQKAGQTLITFDAIDNENYATWTYSRKLYLNTGSSGAKVAGNVTNFPVLIRLNSGLFKEFAQTQPGGIDLRFAKATGAHLPYEIERWVDGPGNNDTAEIWVRVDTILGNNTTQYIKMYWGRTGVSGKSNPERVFDTANAFRGVWHLSESAGSAVDATINGFDATRNGGAARTAGDIGYGQTFDGNGDYFKTGAFNNVNFGGPFTASAWVYLSGGVASPGALWSKANDNTEWEAQEVQFFLGDNTTNADQQGRYPQMVGHTRGYIYSSVPLGTGAWHLLNYVYQQSDNTRQIYIDGQLAALANSTPYIGGTDNANDLLFIGRDISGEARNDFSGSMDELQISITARSADWIRLCYENQKAGQTLITIGVIDNENYAAWPYVQKLYLNTSSSGANVAGTVTSFPVLVRLNPALFKSFSQTLAGGADIRFAKSGGAHLSYEIERWVDGSNYNDTAEIWVKVDTVFGNNSRQFILMYWGKSGVSDRSNGNAVFDIDNAFQGVWHLNESPVGFNTILDRTINANHGTPRNNLTSDDLVNGIIGKSLNFDGPAGSGGDYVRLPASQSMDNTGNMTVSCWFRLTNSGSTDYYGIAGKFKDSASTYSGYLIGRAADQRVRFTVGNGSSNAGMIVASNKTVIDNNWHHAAGVVSAGVMRLFLDGNKQTDSLAGIPAASGGPGTIGRRTTVLDNSYFMGDIDEVRFNNTARSADWIKLSFENQRMGQMLVTMTNIDNDYYSTWPSSQKIYINTTSSGANISGMVTNFPLLVRLNPSTFQGFAATLPGGADIRFSSANRTSLPFEIERWVDGSANNDTAEIWVRVDTIRGNNALQYIQMYWGKSGVATASNSLEVFDITNGFVSAFHLNETAGNALDATANALDAAPRGALPDRDEGVAGHGENFNGAASYYTAGNDTRFSMATGNALTISAWVNRRGRNATRAVIEGIAGKYRLAGSASREYLIANDTLPNTGLTFFTSSDGTASTEQKLYSKVLPVNGTWYHVAGVMDVSAMRVYVNGVLKGSAAKSAVYYSQNADFRIGISDSLSSSNYQTFNGRIDEVVLSRTARSGDWIKLAYETQREDSMRVIIPDHLALPVIASGTPADRTATEGDSALLRVSVAGPGPFQFCWYRERIAPADSIPGQNDSTLRFSSVQLSDAHSYICIVRNGYGSDTSRPGVLTVEPNQQINNPIILTGAFVDSTHVRMTVYRYMGLPLASKPSFPWYADSVWIWYNANGFPLRPQPGEPDLIKLPLGVIRQSASDRFDTLLAVRKYPSTGCYTYYFCASVYWKNAAGGSDSLAPFVDPSNTGDSVYMCDTSALANPLKFSFAYVQQTDLVAVTLSNCTQLDWDLISSIRVQYAIGTGDAVIEELPAASFDRAVDIFTKSYSDSRFEGEEKWVYWEVVPVGKFGNKSTPVRDSCKVGVPRPQNTVTLSVGQTASTSVGLFWTRPANMVDSIRLWYGFQEVPLLYEIPPGVFGLVATLAGSDTACMVSGLAADTLYYFGLQVKQSGLWSLVTEHSRISATTLKIQDTVPMPNLLRLQSLEFDTMTNQIVMQWVVDTAGLSLEAGIVWSNDSLGYPLPNPPATGKVTGIADPGAPMKFSIAMSQTDLQFNSDYFFAVWLRKVNGLWMQPTAASIGKLHIPSALWESIVFFRTLDTVYGLANQVVLRKAVIDPMLVESKVRQLQLPMDGGFIPMSIAVSFNHQNAPPLPLYVGLSYLPMPSGYGTRDLRMYHYLAASGTWMVDTLPVSVDSVNSVYSVKIRASDCAGYPFIVMIDTVKPSITILNDGDGPLAADIPVVLSVETRDNIANARLSVRGGRGGDGFTMEQDVYATRMRDTTYWTVPGELVSNESGLRIVLTASDGRRVDTVNGSRDVVRPVSDSISPAWLQWTPLGTNTILDNPAIGSILSDHADKNGTIRYDNTALRLFRWGKNQWVEYNENERESFNLGPTSVIWLKRRLTSPIHYGKGRTASLRTPYRRTVPSKEWVDFCVPYRFNIRVGDILTASKQYGDSSALLIYEWRKGSGDSLKRYYAEGVYLPFTSGKNDLKSELTSRNNTVYTAYNASVSAVDLVIPGVAVPLSGVTGKQTARKGWNLVVRSFCDEGTISPVYCGYREGGKGVISYPLPPSWNDVRVGIYNKERGTVNGNMLVRELVNGGHTFEFIFENGTGKKKKVGYGVERSLISDDNLHLAVLDPETGTLASSEDSLSLEVEPYGRKYRWLAAGTADYIGGVKDMSFRGDFKLLRTYPNPFKQSLRIQYQVPYAGIEWIQCDVFDPRGRLLWKLQVGPRLHPGKNEIVWNPQKEKAIAAGTLIIRLSGYDGRNRKLGERFTRATYLP